jgi:hypothetical protein
VHERASGLERATADDVCVDVAGRRGFALLNPSYRLRRLAAPHGADDRKMPPQDHGDGGEDDGEQGSARGVKVHPAVVNSQAVGREPGARRKRTGKPFYRPVECRRGSHKDDEAPKAAPSTIRTMTPMRIHIAALLHVCGGARRANGKAAEPRHACKAIRSRPALERRRPTGHGAGWSFKSQHRNGSDSFWKGLGQLEAAGCPLWSIADRSQPSGKVAFRPARDIRTKCISVARAEPPRPTSEADGVLTSRRRPSPRRSQSCTKARQSSMQCVA